MQLSLLTLALTKIYPKGQFTSSNLDLDFTSGNDTLDSRITFSRASNATVVGKDGTIQYAPHNLLTYSEQFDNAVWTKSQATTTANTTVSPDGSITADRFVPQSGLSSSSAATGFTAVVGTTYFVSVYAKQDASNKFLMVQLDGDLWNSVTSAERPRVWFDPTTGQIAATQRILTSGVQSIGNGWYRVWLSVFCSTGGATAVRIGMQSASGSIAGYTGDGISGIYLWGAQLNVGALQPYYPTTVKNLLGYTQEFDNAAWTKSNSFVQTNQIRNNTMQGAVAGTPGTLPTNWTYSGGGLTANVIGIGVEAGINYIDIQFVGTATSGSSGLRFEGNSGVSASTGQTWNSSIFIRRVAGSTSGLAGGVPLGLNLTYLAPGVGSDSASTYIGFDSLEVAAISQNRVLVTATGASTGITTIRPQVILGHTIGNHIDITLRIGLPQLVQGATAGDVVATYGTAKAVMYQAPDGTLSADKLVEDTVNTLHYLNNTAVTVTSGAVHTASWYAKAAGRSTVSAYMIDSGIIASTPSTFDLASGTVVSGSQASIVPVGNGWYRCSVYGVVSSTSCRFRVFIGNSTTTGYTGDGTSGIYIWGAQLSDSASLDPYVYNPGAAPAAAAYYGPRFDYDPVTLQPKGLLIEEQRTNLLKYSESFDNAAWTKALATVVPSNELAPNGVIGAQLLQETTSTGVHLIEQSADSVPINSKIALSVFLKPSGRTKIRINSGRSGNVADSGLSQFSLVGAGVVESSSNQLASIINLVGGWYRCSVIAETNSIATGRFITISLVNDGGTNNYAGDGTSGIYIWGAQLEAGAFPASYIPTTSSQVTRAADVATMQGTNFSSWYNQSEGTLFAEFIKANNAVAGRVVTFSNGTTNNQIRINGSVSATVRPDWQVVDGGVVQANVVDAAQGDVNASIKSAGAYLVNSFALATNSVLGTPDTSGTAPVINQANLGANEAGAGYLNGHIKRLAYWPRRLSDAELQGITS